MADQPGRTAVSIGETLRDFAGSIEGGACFDRASDACNCDKDLQRTRQAVTQALDAASDINTTAGNRKMGPECEWRVVHAELNRLAATFRLKPLPRLRW